MQYDVFISYSSVDQKIAEGVCAYLEQHGIRCFVAYRDIPRGVVWAAAIVEALERSRMMLVLFSRHFNESRQVDREVELAAERGMPILTLRLSDDDFTGVKKYYLKNLNWIDAFPNPERYFESLKKDVVSLLGDKNDSPYNSTVQDSPRCTSKFLPKRRPSLKRWLWPIIACVAIVLLIIFWPTTQIDGVSSNPDITVMPQSEKDSSVTTLDIKQPLEKTSQQAAISVKEGTVAFATTRLYVATSPQGVTVYVNEEKIGVTPIEGKEVDCGSYQIKLSKEGYQEKTFAYTFGDQPVVLNEMLELKPQSEALSAPMGKINGHEYVDLGLSVKWATCNIGASSPNDYGDYFAWGEKDIKSKYSPSNSKTYGAAISANIAGHVSNDVARIKWGRRWRLPTSAELQELVDKCTWNWTSVNGHNGYRIVGPNGQSVFLPAAGWYNGTSLYHVGEQGSYWSATPVETNTQQAVGLYFTNGQRCLSWVYRHRGRLVRPVSD